MSATEHRPTRLLRPVPAPVPAHDKAALRARVSVMLLQARLRLRRLDPGRSIAILLLVLGTVLWSWIVPQAQRRSEQQHDALVRLQRPTTGASGVAAAGRSMSLPQQRLAAFYDTLGERRYAELQLGNVFTIAEQAGLRFVQGEYKLRFDAPSRSWRYQLVLPVRGSYAALRRFTEKMLVAMPFAAIDDLGFSRQTIGEPMLDARLRMTLYLGDGTLPAGPASTAAPGAAAGAASSNRAGGLP